MKGEDAHFAIWGGDVRMRCFSQRFNVQVLNADDRQHEVLMSNNFLRHRIFFTILLFIEFSWEFQSLGWSHRRHIPQMDSTLTLYLFYFITIIFIGKLSVYLPSPLGKTKPTTSD